MSSLRTLSGAIVSAVIIAATAAVIGCALAAESWPTRPIRVISPFPAGSASDTVSRVVLDKVSQLLGQPMVIETKPGAGGIVGFADVAKADWSVRRASCIEILHSFNRDSSGPP